MHQYFTSRGAKVTFGCDSPYNVLSDFVKPSYMVKCVLLDNLSSLDYFDAVYIPGGVPSSSAIRSNSRFVEMVRSFWLNPNNKDKLLCIICSGSEVMIDADMLVDLPAVVGSPASAGPLERGFQAVFKPASNYKGLDSHYTALSYPGSGFSSPRANLVLGKNPDASREFVVAIGSTWMNLNESVPAGGEGVPLWWVDGHYNSTYFNYVTSLDELPQIPDSYPEVNPKSGSFEGKVIGIAISTGAHAAEVIFLNEYFEKSGATVHFICPWWNPVYKGGKVYLHTEPPALVTHLAMCQHGFNDVLDGALNLDMIAVPGGLFSTGGVLRNDGDFAKLLNQFYIQNKGLLFTGTGAQLLIPANIAPGSSVTGPLTIQRDLIDANYNIIPADFVIIQNKPIIIAKDVTVLGNVPYSFLF
eukprot:TRINITY_DN4195_c0_g1_i4.p1 TRINITY_DN4195_c0_g1~~TRINITY_DN4195_c0_g1_i4.p1  ORF type:complete len:414 (-),score=76.18 TRINITY_DN4195_c0_g1_i4:1417-2658(-)